MPDPTFAPTSSVFEGLERIRKNWWLFLLYGIALVIVGSFAITAANIATWATVKVFAVLLLIGGVCEIFAAITGRGWRGFLLHFLEGVLYLILGMIMLDNPLLAAEILTLLIAVSLLVGGLFRVIIALVERYPYWGWALLGGLVSAALGLMIWKQWPFSGLWVIGLFIGIEMIFSGWDWVMLALALRSRRAA